MRVARLLIELGEAPELVRAEDEVDDTEALPQLLGHLGPLGHAAADGDEQVRVLRLGVDERADVPQHAHLRVLAYGAGVDDYQVGLVLVFGEAVAHELYVAAQLLAVRLVLLAAVGVHERQGPARRALRALSYLEAYVPLPRELGGGDLHTFISHCSLLANPKGRISDFIILSFRSGKFNGFEI